MKRRFLRWPLCLSILYLLCMISVALSQGATEFVIDGKTATLDTGIYVQAGDVITITATGEVSPHWGHDYYSADGLGELPENVWFEFALPTISAWSLIGAIGGPPFDNQDYWPQGGTLLDGEGAGYQGAGFIGSNFQGTAPVSGNLFLGVNDNYYSDNVGSFTASVSISRPSSPLPSVPDGTIVFASNRDGSYDIWRINPDGSNLINLTNTTQVNEDYPQISPDGTMIAYITTDNRHLWVMDADGSNPPEIVGGDGINQIYDWCQDSQWIAYVENVDWHHHLHRVNVHTGQDQELSTEDCIAPVFSPDGNEVVFSHWRGGWFTLATVNSDGSNERVIDGNPISMFGLWLGCSVPFEILYSHYPPNGTGSLCKISTDGTNRQCIFDNGLINGCMSCSLSPNGFRIAASIRDQTLGGQGIHHASYW